MVTTGNMRFLLRRTLTNLLLPTLLLVVSTTRAQATPSTSDPASDATVAAHAVNRAEQQALQTRLDLAAWRLDNLMTLRREGNSSWLEVARAEVAVARLTAQLHAAEQMGAFLQKLQQRIAHANAAGGPSGESSAETRIPAVRLGRVGSMRLAAWLAPRQLPASLVEDHAEACVANAAVAVQAAAQQTAEACAAVQETKRLVAELTDLAPLVRNTNELQSAQLRHAAAEAELQLAEALERYHAVEQHTAEHLAQYVAHLDERSATKPEDHDALPNATGLRGSLISCESHPVLHETTLAVAAAEANATGRTRAAETLLQLRSMRLEALSSLQADGCATRQEVDTAQAEQALVANQLDQLRRRQTQLAASYDRLRSAVAKIADTEPVNQPAVIRTSKSTRPASGQTDVDPEKLPQQLLASRAAVAHLIELRRGYCHAQAQLDTLRAEVSMRAALYDKLTNLNQQDDAGQRERQIAKLKLQFAEAQLAAAGEEIEIVRREEIRFVRQVAYQSSVGKLATRQDAGTPRARWAGYVESDEIALFAARPYAPAGSVSEVTHFFGQRTVANVVCATALGGLCPVTCPLDAASCRVAMAGQVDLITGQPRPLLRLAHERLRADRPRLTDAGLHPICIAPSAFLPPSRALACVSRNPLTGIVTCCALAPSVTELYEIPRSLYSIKGGRSRAESLRGRRLVVEPGTSIVTTPTYSSWYSFGIRNANIRTPSGIRATPNGVPWYLPGSPTNFR